MYEPPVNVPYNEPLPQYPQQQPNSRKWLIIVLILLLLCCCCLMFTGSSIWLWYNGDALLEGVWLRLPLVLSSMPILA